MDTDTETSIIPIQQFQHHLSALKDEPYEQENNDRSAEVIFDCGISSGMSKAMSTNKWVNQL